MKKGEIPNMEFVYGLMLLKLVIRIPAKPFLGFEEDQSMTCDIFRGFLPLNEGDFKNPSPYGLCKTTIQSL